MTINISYTFSESYLPTKRHRIPRWREAQGEVSITVKETTAENAPVAFLVKDGYDFTVTGKPVEFRQFEDALWVPAKLNDVEAHGEGLLSVAQMVENINRARPCGSHETGYRVLKDEVEAEKLRVAERYLLIDGVVYTKKGEPRYVIMTFGTGHNHASTALMIDYSYNGNLSKTAYFNALEREQAIAAAKEKAKSRGDTNSIARIGESYDIEVLLPEAVKCKQREEHGEGNPTLNSLNAVAEQSQNASESIAVTMALGMMAIAGAK